MATRKSLTAARKIWQWEPHSAGQREFLGSCAKVKAAACGRRWGKSESAGVDTVLYALEKPNTTQMILAPTADQTQIIMSEVQRRLYSVPGLAGSYTERRSPYWEIVFHDGHGLIEPTRIISRTVGLTGRGLRGRKAHKVRVDEAAFVARRIYENVITPLLADYNGDLELYSTPNGVGDFFHECYLRGLDPLQPRYAKFQFPTRENPFISREYLENEKVTKPSRIFSQEYEAAFLDGEGAVFRKVQKAATATEQSSPVKGHEYVFGLDWARSYDFTVITVFDVTLQAAVAMDRFNQIDFATQQLRVETLCERFRPVAIIAEANSIGQPNIEALQTRGLPVQPFTTTNATKAELVDTLALALEREDVTMIPDAVLMAEILAYTGKKLPSGLMQYGAPEGQHDDCVMSLMLAVWGASNSGVEVAPSLWN